LLQWQAPGLPCGKPDWVILAGADDRRQEATLLVGGPEGIAAVEAASGKVRWSVDRVGPTHSPAVSRGRVFLTSPSGKVLCLTAR
jgi:hypothetical protein